MDTTNTSSDTANDSAGFGNNPIPSWVRLLDSPLFAGSDVTSVHGSRKEAPDANDAADLQPELQQQQQGESWYHSPLFNRPVTGYYNRVTQSNLSLNQPFGEGQPPSAQAPPPTANNNNNTSQWAGFAAPPPAANNNNSHWTNLIAPSYTTTTAAVQRARSEDVLSPSSRSRHAGEHETYSELYSPWLKDWPRELKDRSKHPDKPPGFLLQNGAGSLYHSNSKAFLPPTSSADKRGGGGSDFFQHRVNGGFWRGSDNVDVDYGLGSVGDMSRDRPDVLKPEEYLSGLQNPDVRSDSIPYGSAKSTHARCPCWATSLLVLMGMVIVGLAVALTVSVLGKRDFVAGEKIQGGYPVVRASLALKILNKNFTLGMDNPGSHQFYSVASPYSKELDRLFLLSPLREIYRGNKVTALGPGSVKARAELLFLDTGLVQDNTIVQNVISSADRASQWKQSNAREIGQFVVCVDCATVSLDFTRVRQLPPRPVLSEKGNSSVTSSPSKGTPSTNSSGSTVTNSSSMSSETSAVTVTTPIVDLRNTTPFLSDGHFVISCDARPAPADWSTLTIEFKSDNSTSKHPAVVLATLRKESENFPEVAESVQSRVSAFPDVSAQSVGLVVNVTSMTCADTGDYRCRLTLRNRQGYTDAGRVEVQELPTQPVVKESWSSTAWEAAPVFSCSAQLGYPPGKLTLSIGDNSSPNLRPISGHVTKENGCEAATEVRVSSLDAASLGNGSRLLCQLYSSHLQLLDSTQYSVFHQITLSTKLEIQTKSASIDHGLAAIRCRLLNPGTWTRLTLQRLASDDGGSSEDVVSMSRDGSFEWTDFRLRHRSLVTSDVRATRAEFSVFIFSIKCVDEALYACAVRSQQDIVPPRAFLNVTVNPTTPELTVPTDVTENYVTPFPVTCRAEVGRPAGRLVLAAKHQDEADFRELAFNEQTMRPLSCTTEVRGIFYPGEGALRNGTFVSCRVVPHESLRPAAEKDLQVAVFEMLPEDLCAGAQDKNISHPTDCRHIVHCKNDVIANVSKCPDGFCVSAETGSCVELPPEQKTADSLLGDGGAACLGPDKDDVGVTSRPHPHQCSSYVQCQQGREVVGHCPAGQLYVANRRCSADVTQSHCYRTLDTSQGVVTNTSVIS